LNKLIQDVSSLYETSKINITYDLVPEMPDILGDGTMLRQVLHNLMQNAQDALTDQDAPEILVKTDWDKAWVKLIVSDNGQGFPENVLAHAYEPYVTTKAHGTGLGLAIVKKMVEEHSGQIVIENNPFGGACITIQLPLENEGQNELKLTKQKSGSVKSSKSKRAV
jgi:nitrogen fixation/metabolism regulation signal transduction histidine kinase